MASLSGAGRQPVYLLDLAVYKPPEHLRVNRAECEVHGRNWSMYSEEAKAFLVKVHEKSGLAADGTFLPAAIHPQLAREPAPTIPNALDEARTVMTGAVEDLFARTGLRPQDVDILITNSSIFCPTPSLASMLVNHFKMRPDVQSYHLGGMGCGNGVMAVGLVRDLLQARPNSVALFVPAEITTAAFYSGVHKQFMVANAIFRMGGAAVAFSNRAADARRAKYQLCWTARVHTGGESDAAYRCMAWTPDADGVNGVYLGRDVVDCAGGALSQCMKAVAPKIMTWRQYAEAAFAMVAGGGGGEPYAPDFTRCAQHFAIHAGGYAVLKGVQAGLRLPAAKMLPSFAALRDYGNTSCSTTWYVMAYMESTGAVRKGETVLQLGVGGGVKAGVNVWRALQGATTVHVAWRHLAAAPLTEDDLPRAIVEGGGGGAAAAATKASSLAAAAAADKDAGGGKAVPRKLTISVSAGLTDEQLAELAH